MDKKEIKKTIRKEIAHLKKNHTMEWQEKMSALILSKPYRVKYKPNHLSTNGTKQNNYICP